VAQVRQVAGVQPARFAAVIRASEQALLSFSVPARLHERPVKVGQRVARHQLLASIDDRELALAAQAARAARAEIEARLAQAQRDVERVRQLNSVDAATREELEHAQTLARSLASGRDAALTRLDDAERLLAEARLLAPFPGTVTAVLSEPGEQVAPGMPVVELQGERGLELEVGVPESMVFGLSQGQPVQVELPFAQTPTVTGRIDSVARAAQGPGRLFPVLVSIEPAPGVVVGMTAELVLQVNRGAELAVPLAAVLNPGSSTPVVFRISAGRAERVAVRLGRLEGELVTVEGQLAVGDLVAVAAQTGLSDGDAVEVQ